VVEFSGLRDLDNKKGRERSGNNKKKSHHDRAFAGLDLFQKWARSRQTVTLSKRRKAEKEELRGGA